MGLFKNRKQNKRDKSDANQLALEQAAKEQAERDRLAKIEAEAKKGRKEYHDRKSDMQGGGRSGLLFGGGK